MQSPEDDIDEAAWCADRRREVAHYVAAEGLPLARVEAEPSWFVAPYISVWSVEDAMKLGFPGAWVVCGDLPTDYVAASAATNARDAIRVLARRWFDVAGHMARGEPHPEFSIGPPAEWSMLAPLLRSRAELLEACADDAELWPEV